MTQEQKVIRAKVGMLELDKQLGNVSQACRVMSIEHEARFPSCDPAHDDYAPATGVDLSVIALWFGHEHLDTTHIYIGG
ncbi:hypothetical protein R8510_04697 [Ralstonia chuxiongensis]|nr:hypothetical protein [Ralstonia chuxiongensis]CAJ0780074.1 hypothetical protein R8510_04697 [Ralstonia chuxiongensis]